LAGAAPTLAGGLLAIICLACCIALLFVPEPRSTIRESTLSKTLVNVFKDLWSLARSRARLAALFYGIVAMLNRARAGAAVAPVTG
jgi:hypothetical protein